MKDVTSCVVIEQQLRDDNRSIESTQAHFEELSIKDGLTGIHNRRYFDVQFDVQCRIARRNKEPLALLMIDVDQFKPFNDTYGHQMGDSALKKVAECLNQAFQGSSDFVARYGGKEFVVVCASMTQAQAVLFAERLCERVRSLEIPHSASSTGFLTASVGFSVRLLDSQGAAGRLLKQADQALYFAKERGRNQSIGL
jgi:diguanylate cyclase (GGDEF)-like protein